MLLSLGRQHHSDWLSRSSSRSSVICQSWEEDILMMQSVVNPLTELIQYVLRYQQGRTQSRKTVHALLNPKPGHNLDLGYPGSFSTLYWIQDNVRPDCVLALGYPGSFSTLWLWCPHKSLASRIWNSSGKEACMCLHLYIVTLQISQL